MKQIKKIGLWCILLFACIQISGCGDGQTSWKSEDHEISSELTYEKSMDLDYATEFAVDFMRMVLHLFPYRMEADFY